MIAASLTILLAVRDPDRGKQIAATMRGDKHTVIVAFDATAAINLTWQHKPDAIVFDPSLAGADTTSLARRLRRAGLDEAAVIVALGDHSAHIEDVDVDYQLPGSFDLAQLSGLIHYARSERRKKA